MIPSSCPPLILYLRTFSTITALCPLGLAGAPLFKNTKVNEIASKYNKAPAQVLLSWAVQRGTSAIPKFVTDSRFIENFQDFVLEYEDMNTLSNLEAEPRHLYTLGKFHISLNK